MGLFSKPKIPGINTGVLNNLAEQNAAKQRNIITGLKGNLAPIGTDFESKRSALSGRIPMETEQTLGQFRTDLGQLNAGEQAQNEQAGAAFRERAFRDVPETQRSIRESLGGSGLLGSGAAASALARPTLDAARASRDFSSGLETARLGNVVGRGEKLADTGFNARSGAMATRLGLDSDTINYLTSIGREDLIREAEGLLGTEEQLGANKLGIEQARQANDIAQATAAASRRGNIISGLTQLGGAGIGAAVGGPLGAGIGGQLGGTVGQFASGSPVSFDPTLLYALSQRKNSVSKPLSGGRSTMPGFSPY